MTVETLKYTLLAENKCPKCLQKWEGKSVLEHKRYRHKCGFEVSKIIYDEILRNAKD